MIGTMNSLFSLCKVLLNGIFLYQNVVPSHIVRPLWFPYNSFSSQKQIDIVFMEVFVYYWPCKTQKQCHYRLISWVAVV